MNRKFIEIVEGLVTYDFTLHSRAHEHTILLWKCLGTAFGHFFWAPIISWSRLLVGYHCILRFAIGDKGQDRPSSLHTRR
jgi:hypothetical protein